MKIKFGALMVDARGKIGGHVASKNRGGSYMRTKVTPVNPQSSAQTGVRNKFTTIAQAWRALTAAQRASFNGAVANFAKTDIFGDLRNPSGSNLHQRLNLNLGSVGATFITTAPAMAASPAGFQFTPTATAATPTVSIAWTSGAVPAGVAVVIDATPCLSPGKTFVKNRFRQTAILPAADVTPTAILTEYAAKFGNPIAGQRIFFRGHVVSTTTGVVSGYFVTSCIVGA